MDCFGFREANKLLSNMELCGRYIVQLLGLSFFQQPVSPKTSEAYYEQATFFTMHDLVHDLAISLLGNQILDQSKQGNTRGSSCQYALLRDCSRPLELCLTSPARLIALHFLEGCRSELSGAAFSPARSLRVLDLSECSIRRLLDAIGQLTQLRYLDAPQIQDIIFPECITRLSNLIYLNLYGSSICALTKSIGKLERLMHLDLSNCRGIHGLPVSLRNLEKLAHLDLSNCHWLIGVLESLQSLSRLEHLNLSSCYMTGDLTRAMRGLIGLQYLNLSNAPCVGLQQVLVNLTKLRYLNLEGSLNRGLDEAEIGSLLECICSLSNLEYLTLAWNGDLRTIPESIGNLRKLNTLDLSYCSNLQRLPASLAAIYSLRVLNVTGCSELDKSTLPQNKSSSALLPHFVVHAGDGESSNNLSELEDKHPTLLDISRLEKVKSAEQAKRIRLAEKQSIVRLELSWTRDAKRFADDREVLSELVPPHTLKTLSLKGYNSISFPSWLMSIATCLRNLVFVVFVSIQDLPGCNVLPPLGQLPNLECLKIDGMSSIRKIDGGFYGGRSAFPRLQEFAISRMECLEEWNAEDGLSELAFPTLLRRLSLNRCPLLRFKACSPPAITSWENRGHVSASSSTATTTLHVKCCAVPLHHWSLLRHLPCLKNLRITDCSDLTCGSTDLVQCISSLETPIVEDCKNGIVALQERLGDLTSLTGLELRHCNGINSLLESIQQLRCLRRLVRLPRWSQNAPTEQLTP